jgi:hypothetical protein
MADRATVDASLVVLGYADAANGTFKDVVCEQDSNVSMQRNEVSETTKCGTLKDLGPQNVSFSGNIVVVTDQANDEASHDELVALFTGKTKKYWRWTDVSNSVFVGGWGWVSQYNPSAASEGTVKASITITIDGDIDTQPTS